LRKSPISSVGLSSDKPSQDAPEKVATPVGVSNHVEFQKKYFPSDVGKKCPYCGEKVKNKISSGISSNSKLGGG
jgi:hypothetical protein